MHINIWGNNNKEDLLVVNLIAVYNTVAESDYEHIFSKYSQPIWGAHRTVKGAGLLWIAGEKYLLEPDQIIFHSYNDLEKIKANSANWEFNAYYFTSSRFDFPCNKIIDLPYSDDEKKELFNIVEYLHRTDALSLTAANALLKKQLAEWLIKIVDRYDEVGVNEQLIKDSLNFINQKIHQKISVSDVALQCGFSEKHYRTLFLKYIGINPKEYILKLKISYAEQMLLFSQFSIKEIAYSLNFSSEYHFNNEFKRKTGVTPTQYRKQNAEEREG
jgi:AraC-like DNA-binding protein